MEATKRSRKPKRPRPYWITSGFTTTQFLSALTGNPSSFCRAADASCIPVICFRYFSPLLDPHARLASA